MRGQRISKVMIVVLFIGICISGTAIAGNKEYIDQQQPNDINAFSPVNLNGVIGQTFRPEIKGHLTRVALKLKKVLGYSVANTPIYPGDLIVEIRPTIGNVAPNDEVMATASIKELQIAEETPQWYEAIFENPPALSSENTYTIVLRVMEEVPSDLEGTRASYSVCYSADDVVDPYPSGMLIGKGAGTPYWFWLRLSDWNFMDAAFATYMARGMN